MNTQSQEPQMSELSSIFRVFYEPGEVFEDLKRRPRFVAALILMIVVAVATNFMVVNKIGMDRILNERMEKGSSIVQLTPEQREKAIESQSSILMKTLTYGGPVVAVSIIALLGALYYWGASNAMGGSTDVWRALSVWVYSSLPPLLVHFVGNGLVAVFKPADRIDLSSLQGGLFQANLNAVFELGGAAGALISTVDLFIIWGWVLAVIGLKKIAKLSTGSAWGIVLFAGLFMTAFKVVGALFN